MPTEALMTRSVQAATATPRPHVLVVDDDPTTRELVSDYLGKNELRVTAVGDGTAMRRRRAEVRQGKPDGIRAFRFDGWELNLNLRRLTSPDGRTVALTNGEFSLLVVLLGAPSRILSRDQLLDLSRLHNDEVYNRSIDVQIL